MTIQKDTALVLDTETADLTGAVYDVGYTIADKKGNIILERTWLVEEIFTNAKKMMGAFYAGKLFTHYAGMLERGEIRLTPWATIIDTLRADMAEHNVTILAAYNAGFDTRVMTATHKMLGFTGKVLAQPVKILDLWQFACETKLSQKQYKKIAIENGWVSPKGNIKTGAEFAYRFITRDFQFVEDHTALSDARIETEIMAECFRMKKRVPYGIMNAHPWRIVNQKEAA